MSDERLTRIEDKVDRLLEEQVKIRKDLKYHIKRTNLLEAELKPVRDHVTFIRVVLKWLAVAGVIAGIAKVFL